MNIKCKRNGRREKTNSMKELEVNNHKKGAPVVITTQRYAIYTKIYPHNTHKHTVSYFLVDKFRIKTAKVNG